VVQATLKEARFRDGSLPAIGFFDVMEHIRRRAGIFGEVHRCLAADGRIYLIPCRQDAGLWSGCRCAGRAFPSLHVRQFATGIGACWFSGLCFMSKMFSPPAPALVPEPISAESFWPSAAACPEPLPPAPTPRADAPEGCLDWELARLASGRSIPAELLVLPWPNAHPTN